MEQWSKCPQSMAGERLGVYALWAACYALLTNPAWQHAPAGGIKEYLKRSSRSGSHFEREWAALSRYLKLIRAPYAENRFVTFYELYDTPREDLPAIRFMSSAEGRRYAARHPRPKVQTPERWTAVPVSILRDRRLSLRAKGLFILMQRRMDLQGNESSYRATKVSLLRHERLTRGEVDTAWTELKAAGLLEQRFVIGEGGRFAWEYRLPHSAGYAGELTGEVRAIGGGRQRRKRVRRHARRQAYRNVLSDTRPRATEQTRAQLREQIMQRIGYDYLAENDFRAPCARRALDGYVDLMVDAAATAKATVRIGGEDIPAEEVRRRMLMITCDELLRVDANIAVQQEIRNPRAYKLTALYRAVQTLDTYDLGVAV